MNIYITKKNVFTFIILFFILLSISTLTVFIPICLQRGLDAIFASNLTLLLKYSMIILSISIIKYILSIVQKYISSLLAWNVTNDIRLRILYQLRYSDIIAYQKITTGSLYEYIETDIKNIFNFLSTTLINFILQSVLIIGILMVIYQESQIIFLVFLLYLMLSLYVLVLLGKNGDKGSIAVERSYSTLVFQTYSELINGKKDLHTLGAFKFLKNKLNTLDKEWLPLKLKAQSFLYKFWSLTVVITSLFSALSLFLGGYGYSYGIVSIGGVYLLYKYSTLLSEPLKNVQAYVQNIHKFNTSLKRIMDFIETKSTIAAGPNALTALASIKVKHLFYSYDQKSKILNDVSLSIDRYEHLGIYGPSGCGKSTLSKLICKQLDYEKGEILINDIPLHNFTIESIRNKFAYIKADDQVFHATLLDNLTFFDKSIESEVVIVCLKELKLDNYSQHIQIQKLDEKIDPKALSKNEIQLINMIRLLFQDKEFIIFDESSSNVDVNHCDYFFEILKRIIKNRTSIIISHNSNHLKLCDRVIDFQNLQYSLED